MQTRGSKALRNVLGKRTRASYAYKKGVTPAAKKVKYFQTTPANKAYFQMAAGMPAAWNPIGSEIKAIDIPLKSYLLQNPNAGSNIILLNGVQTGAAYYNRIGARIEMKNLHMRGFFTPVGPNSPPTMARIIIVYDRQPGTANGSNLLPTLPQISEVLQSRDQTGAPATTGASEINLDNRDRYIILRDYEVYLPAVYLTAGVTTLADYSGVGNTIDINEFVKLKGLGVQYKSSSNPTAIGDFSTGALYACFVCVGDATWEANVGFRLRYNDK